MTTREKSEVPLPDTAPRHAKQFVPYLQSLTQELAAIQTRVRLLVQHWPSDGHSKESILRQVLRRHLPASVSLGTGFVVNYFEPSGEIDILITDDTMPTLFRDGELVIVAPESVRAIIEVKTSLSGPAAIEAAAANWPNEKPLWNATSNVTMFGPDYSFTQVMATATRKFWPLCIVRGFRSKQLSILSRSASTSAQILSPTA